MSKTKTRKNLIKRCINISVKTPIKDGFYMPGEFEKQEATWLGWPSNPGTFRINPAQKVIEKVARIIAKYQKVHIVVQPSSWDSAYELFKDCKNIFVTELNTNDSWLRDIAPTFLIKNVGKDIYLRSIGWKFNGWGNPKEIKHDLDALAALKISNTLAIPFYKKFDFVCEGGSFSVDGQGTLITTEECLLKHRNKNLTRSQIDTILCNYLNLSKVIWLPYGVANDTDTTGHVDNMCVFVGVGKVILTWPKGCGTPECKDKEQEKRSLAALKVLENSKDANGNQITVYKMPHPPELKYTKDEINTLPFTKGSFVREEGVRLAASHVNLIITNNAIVVPVFNSPTDSEALKLMSEIFPDRHVYGVYAREIVLGGGNIHCMSQQQPFSNNA
jgi:agmatine deiminase